MNNAIGFKSVTATGSSTDTATLYDGPGNNTFSGNTIYGTLSNVTTSYGTKQFGFVNIVASEGAFDQALVGSINYTLTKYGTWH